MEGQDYENPQLERQNTINRVWRHLRSKPGVFILGVLCTLVIQEVWNRTIDRLIPREQRQLSWKTRVGPLAEADLAKLNALCEPPNGDLGVLTLRVENVGNVALSDITFYVSFQQAIVAHSFPRGLTVLDETGSIIDNLWMRFAHRKFSNFTIAKMPAGMWANLHFIVPRKSHFSICCWLADRFVLRDESTGEFSGPKSVLPLEVYGVKQ